VRIAIFGAGAIGGYLAVELARAGQDVTAIARGPHLAAIRERGLRLLIAGEERVAHPAATDDPAEAGPQDVVIVTLKANSLPAVAPSLAPLLGPDTAVVTAMNGVPYWYFYQLEGPYQDRRIESVDPGGELWDRLPPERAIGCVVYPSCEVVEPGVIRHLESDRFLLGEPDGSRSERVERLSDAMIEAGFKAPVRPRIRDDIWVKLWGNMCFNPVSVLTHATLDVLATDPGTRAVCRKIMDEGREVGEALGARFTLDVEKRIDGAAAVGAHKTSMLQDLERGRPMEIEPLVGAVAELARIVEIETPTLDAVLALVRLRAEVARPT
jgi:2-dehydropantoate 2-reductase